MSDTEEKTHTEVPCRYCKHDVPKGIRRCPYCGTLNPTVTPKDAFVWTVGVIVAIYLLGFVTQTFR